MALVFLESLFYCFLSELRIIGVSYFRYMISNNTTEFVTSDEFLSHMREFIHTSAQDIPMDIARLRAEREEQYTTSL